MKLSEAIRLGSMLAPQGRGGLVTHGRRFFGLFGPTERRLCALGAAYEATGKLGGVRGVYERDEITQPFRGQPRFVKAGEAYYTIETPHEWNTDMVVPCPQCKRDELELYRLIPHLNDDHRWTRERIADFVATLEPADVEVRFEEGWRIEIHASTEDAQTPATPAEVA